MSRRKTSKQYGISYTKRGKRVSYKPNQSFHAAKVERVLKEMKEKGYKNPRKFKLF